ncbi:uncharacterized protein L969DRAFT_94873 [Mixia osmundae IAM 14324]|uniref:DNA helicase n=1 Tax=Mixia osmundae (strain CBS 9802 / IAM 14324 / JCM 22182 / KY 12970) TaxID=764103 RepID=G7E230_MIXOS|nr:uncharacterized protein L969DRAFT_94873 [Mixia osmundae IAM 14324]KEI38675.1 hypothetical protein L969DRAFT_94873 [Mixia osmundae IAM 14324]GAA96867.1 hypothetical protein E5Q_03540 [Mixia osmundae IAM 14324]
MAAPNQSSTSLPPQIKFPRLANEIPSTTTAHNAVGTEGAGPLGSTSDSLRPPADDDDKLSDIVMDSRDLSRVGSRQPSTEDEEMADAGRATNGATEDIKPRHPLASTSTISAAAKPRTSTGRNAKKEEAGDDEDEILSEEDEDDSDDEPTPYVGDDANISPAKRRALLEKEERANIRRVEKAKKAAQNSQLASRKTGNAAKKAADTIKRFSYLLGQSDIFMHFCNLKKEREPEFAAMLEEAEISRNADTSRKSKAKAGASRGRKTEKEEDAELLREDDENDGSKDDLMVFTESPAYVKGGKMRDYQIQGLNWMIGLHHNGINGILADEMGLGKTLQTISFLGYLKFYRGITGPHLIVVPKSTLDNWSREVAHWVPGFRSIILSGPKEERAEMCQSTIITQEFDVLITSYEICQREKSTLKKLAWEYIIIDEAHRIKNVNSILSQIVRLFDSRGRLLITGTPLQNDLHELWALLNYIIPDCFSDVSDFDRWFERKGGEGEDADSVVKQLHKVLRPFLLRRVKADVEKSLLPKKEVNIYVGLTDMQRQWYKSILEKDIDAVNGAGGKKEGKTRLLNIVMQLRKCCNHPYLFDGAEPGPPFTTDEHLVQNAGKMVVLDKLLTSMKAKGSRVLIFSQMSRVLDILEDYCFFRGHKYCRIDGSTDHADRISAIDDYNRPGSEKFVFLLTTRAGGLGINLTTADVVVLYDSDWNPQADLQAMDRAHRIGQTKQVYVFRFVTEDSVEEKVLERAAQKLRLDQLVIQQGRATVSKAQSKDELVEMIQHGAERIIKADAPANSMMIDDDVDLIIQRGEARTAELNKKYETLNIDDLANFKSESATTNWEGEAYGKKKAIGMLWIEPSKRERKTNYSVDNYYRDALRTGGEKKGPARNRGPRQPQTEDFQFFPPAYAELLEKEHNHNRKLAEYKVPAIEDPSRTPEELEKERAEAQEIIDNAEPLTEQEALLKEGMGLEGFDSWHRKHFQGFIRGCEKAGREDYAGIQSEIPDKTVEEIEDYAKVFWERYREVDGWERQLQKIEVAEAKRQKDAHITLVLREKINEASHPYQKLDIPYAAQSKGKVWSEDEDRFLLIKLNLYGIGTDDVYERIKADVLEWPGFRFDWFIRSRNAPEINRRCITLLNLIEKEAEEKERKAKRAKDSSSPVKKANGKNGKITVTVKPNGSSKSAATKKRKTDSSRASTPSIASASGNKKAKK